jgi:hypothetical protein
MCHCLRRSATLIHRFSNHALGYDHDMKGMVPNFFIIGAPKCGTTALYDYLTQHPRVFMSKLKEPHYFASDLSDGYRAISTAKDYQKLFADVKKHHIAVGEASVLYMFSAVAVEGIRKFNPDARLIAMLRNPIDLAYSWHSQALFAELETEPDFETAWKMQERRAHGLDVPLGATEPRRLQYRSIAALGTQVRHLLDAFPREQIQFIFNDEFGPEPQKIFTQTLAFLGLPPADSMTFRRVNANKRVRSRFLKRMVRNRPGAVRKAESLLNERLGLGGTGLLAMFSRLNSVEFQRPPLSSGFRRELQREFEHEIELLGDLLGADLSRWMR